MKSASAVIRVGIIDSGCRSAGLGLARAFRQDGSRIIEQAPTVDQIGHGTSIENTIRLIHSRVECHHAQIFHQRPVATPALVAAGLLWLKARAVDVICMSLGMKQDREVLARACRDVVAANIILVAASPVQGPMSFPAAYEGVIAATGDARCAIGQISRLNHHSRTVYGNWCASPEHTGLQTGGASIGCAVQTGIIASILAERGSCSVTEMEDLLDRRAVFQGREYRNHSVRTHA